jgi:hypothetical protein
LETKDLPPDLLAYLKLPEAPQAAVNEPGDVMFNPSPPSRESTPEADPLAQTLDLIPKSTHGSNLIKFLAEKPNRTAKLKDACKHVYKSIAKPTLAKARRLIDRNAKCLEGRNAPLRIVRNSETVSLIGR